MSFTRLVLGAAAVAIVFALLSARRKASVVSAPDNSVPAQIAIGTQVADNGPYVVVNVNISKARDAFLNIGAAYPNQTLTVVIAEADIAKFDVESYVGKRIMVRGMITAGKGKPEIKVTDPSRIRIIP